MSHELKLSRRPLEKWTSSVGVTYLVSRNPKKYPGSVMKDGKRFRFSYRVRGEEPHNESFGTREEAEEAQRRFCLEKRLIKNYMVDKGDYVEMYITDGFMAKIDYDDVLAVDERLWHLARSKAAKNNYLKSKDIYLHDLVLGVNSKKKHGQKLVVVHEDGDNLNHRRKNLKLKKKVNLV